MEENNQSKLLTLALTNRQIAVAILGQAIMDEGGIGASAITIYYTSKREAEHLWQIANSLGYAGPLRKKKHRNHHHYGFTILAAKRKEFYDQIGPLPNPTKDRVFRHLANRPRSSINLRPKGETRKLILKSLRERPKTVLQLMLEMGASASAIRRHLQGLQRQGLVKVYGRYKDAFQKSRRTAYLWTAL